MEKIQDLILMPKHLTGIYYIKTPEGDYIGQALDIRTRLLRHRFTSITETEIDKVINKYKEKNLIEYYLIEICDIDKLNEKEQYWISYYDTYKNGLNQTPGGAWGGIPPKFNEKEAKQIINLILSNKTIRFEEIAKNFNCSINTIQKINLGLQPYYFKEYNYPLRSKDESRVLKAYLGEEKILNILNDLRNTTMTMTEIGQKYNLCRNTISDINKGKKEPINNYEYPARKTRVGKK